MAIEVISTIRPKNGAPFPVVVDSDIKGGYHAVQNISERDTIPLDNLKDGMAVFVVDQNKYYSYVSSSLSWIPSSIVSNFVYTINNLLPLSAGTMSADTYFYLDLGKAASLKANFVVLDSGNLAAHYEYNVLVKNTGSGLLPMGNPILISHHSEITMGADPAHTFSFYGDGVTGKLLIDVTNNEPVNSANIKGSITYNII
jgi:hypothetical protein